MVDDVTVQTGNTQTDIHLMLDDVTVQTGNTQTDIHT